jgi:serine/threonine protein kinase
MENNEINQDYIIDKIFLGKYKCVKIIGKGSFSMVYKAENDSKYYAIKLERKELQNLLENESTIMNFLKGPNIPYIKTYGSSGDFNILVMQLLGKDLQTLFSEKKNSFSLKTVCMLAYQMITILENIHKKNIIHRDIKPENFLMGLPGELNSIFLYLIDFGLSKFYYKNSVTECNTKKDRNKMTGTPRYASINALRGLEQGKKDDLESIGYVLIYLLKGSLPWQSINVKNKLEKLKKILVLKIETPSSDLCNGLPQEFEIYLDYCKNLELETEPDYNMLKNLFLQVLYNEKMKFDYIYDWSTSKDIEISNSYIYSNNKIIFSYIPINLKSIKNKYILTTNDKEFVSLNYEKENSFIETKNEEDDKSKDNKDIEESKEIKENKNEVCCCILI